MSQLERREEEARVRVSVTVNGTRHVLDLDPRSSLLDVLREQLALTGAKKGCDHGQCGACTVLVDGRRIVSCLTLAVMQDGAEITTIEGLGDGGRTASAAEGLHFP
jgi:xanthine dehydrogenase YagT iron-sulfur-binding subunit